MSSNIYTSMNSTTESPASTIMTTPNISEGTVDQSPYDLESPISMRSFRSSLYAKRKERLNQPDIQFNSPQLRSSGLTNEVSLLRRQLIGMVGITIDPCTPQNGEISVFSKYGKKNFQTSDPKPFSRKFDQIYDLGRKIGEGGSSVVKECYLKSTQSDTHQKQKYAVKIVKFSDTEQLFNVIEEQRILSMLKHQNIVELVDFFIDKNKHSVHLIMEKCEGKSLTQLIRKKYNFSEMTVKHIIRTLLRTLHYIHMKGICHRDLSNNNVIYDQNTRKVKLIDFSVSKECRNRHRKMWTKTGTLQFVAPEAIQEEKDGYDPRVDIWSIGVIMFSLLTGDLPFIDPNDNEIGLIELIINSEPEYQNYISKNLISQEAHLFLKQFLEKDPSKRITIRQALSNPWLQEKIDTVTIIHNQDKIVKIMKSPVFNTNKLKGNEQMRLEFSSNKQRSLVIKKQPSFTNLTEANTKNANGENDYNFSPRSKVISISNPMSLYFHKLHNYEAK